MAYHLWIIISGILGNILSFMVYLAPLPTFVGVYRKKSTEGFQSIPYVVALLSCMLWVYYATLKSNADLLMTINAIGCFVESLYIIVFLIYAPKKARISTVKLLLVLNLGGIASVLLLTHFFAKGSNRIHIVGWFCVVTSAAVFAAPLSIMRLVIHTKSVEFMPFTLSFFLTLSAITWLVYGLLLKDFYVALPNIVGVALGMIQMALYLVYKNYNIDRKHDEEEEIKQPALVVNSNKLARPVTASNGVDSSDVEVGRDANHQDELQRSHKSADQADQPHQQSCAV